MAQMYHQFVDKLDKLLHENNRFSEIFDKLEKSTSVKRVYIAQGLLALLSVYMIFGYFAELVCNGVGFIYPAYASIHALESHVKDDDTKWLTYWVVFALFSVIEFFSENKFSWFPFYWLFTVLILVWCFVPFETNGSSYIYSRVIRPVFLKNRNNIDDAFSTAVGAATGVANRVIESARKQE